jgi:hypothetical protein
MHRGLGLVLGILLLVAGCQGINGPWAHKREPVNFDDPRLNMDEKQRLGRDRLAIPELTGRNVAPSIDTGIPR